MLHIITEKAVYDVTDDVISPKSPKNALEFYYLSFEPKHDIFWSSLDDDPLLTSA